MKYSVNPKFLTRFLIAVSFLFTSVFAYADEPAQLEIFRKSYPDVSFTCKYDSSVDDYLITVSVGKRSTKLYWQEGKFLPKSELKKSDDYTTLLYKYNKEIPDPSDFTKEDIKKIREFSSTENRQNGPGTPPFFFDAIYDCETRGNMEKHVTKTTFLGKKINVHERLVQPLKNVEKKINALSGKNSEVKSFMNNLSSAESYNWRVIADSRRRSFHSIGVAVDLLPKGWSQKNIYWAWRRDIDPDWMLLPLNKRWLPPDAVIEAFEEEGFIYGGKWIVWDNMHFEYRPELIIYSDWLENEKD